MSTVIGDRLAASLPTFQGGQPEANTWRLQDIFNRAVVQYLEDPTIQGQIAALQAALSGALSVASLIVAGSATVGTTLGVTGVGTFNGAGNGLVVTNTGLLGALSCTGNATVGGTLGVTGASNFGGVANFNAVGNGIIVNDTALIAALHVTGVANLDGAVTTGALSASALTTAQAAVHHGTLTTPIDGSSFVAISATSPTRNAVDGRFNSPSGAAATAQAPINLPVGERLQSVVLYVRSAGASGGSTTLKVFKLDMTTGTATQLGATQTDANVDSAFRQLTVSALAETIADGFRYYIQGAFTSTADTVRQIQGGKFTSDRP